MDIEFGGNNTKAKGLGIAGIALAIALALLDFVVLRGDCVATARAPLSGNEPAVLELARTGEEHLIEISTRRRSSGESKGRSIGYRLEDPEGRVIVEDSELVSRKKRYLSFEPQQAGEYRLFVEDPRLIGASTGSAAVSVYVGDRRILRRFSF